MGYWKMHFAATVSLLNAIGVGIAATYSATATESMQMNNSRLKPSKNDISWIGSILAIGALVGGIVAGYLSNKLGRKGLLMYTSVPFVFGWLLIACAPSVEYVLAGRFITGFCVGLICVVSPIYLVEISTPEERGALGVCFQLYISLGIFIVALLGMFLPWNWLAVSGAVTALISVIFLFPMPESPRWLVVHKKHTDALNAIGFLRGGNVDASIECVAIADSIKREPVGRLTLHELSQPTIYKPALLSLGLMFFQQFSGANAVLFYTVSIFKDAGSSLEPVEANIFVALTMMSFTYVSSRLMDKAGRRIFLIVSGFIMFLALNSLGIYAFISNSDPAIKEKMGWFPLLCLLVYIAAFSVGLGPIPWLMMAEISPLRARSAICAMGTAMCWLFAFIITKTFIQLQGAIYDYGAYWCYGGFCFLSCIFTWFFLPETKGKTFEEIAGHFSVFQRLGDSPSRYGIFQ